MENKQEMATLTSEQAKEKALAKWHKSREYKLRDSRIWITTLILVALFVAGMIVPIATTPSIVYFPITSGNVTYIQDNTSKSLNIEPSMSYELATPSDKGYSLPVIFGFLFAVIIGLCLTLYFAEVDSRAKQKYISQILQQLADNNKQLPVLLEYEKD